VCDGTGWKIVVLGGDRRATPCDCALQARGKHLLANARIPARYINCELDNYKTTGILRAAEDAKMAAWRFVERYLRNELGDQTGLLFFGGIGRGKTHLAVGIIKQLISRRCIPCLFYDYGELLKQIQNSYNASVDVTEMEVLKPVFEVEVLLLDDLGSIQSSAWVWDTISLILNTRYNERRTTIITTNLQDAPPRKARQGLDARSREAAVQANQEFTLGDRITERIRSRLHEMCRIVNISVDVPDYRSGVSASSH
jgi:DNA replication protein DnaC